MLRRNLKPGKYITRMRGRWVVALIAVIVLAAAGAGAAVGATGRTFEPDYRMSKQYVAVATYKILRDHAPQSIRACESDVKKEPDRFEDLGNAGAFTRGAINCLDKLGYLEGLPGGSQTPGPVTAYFGDWQDVSGSNIEFDWEEYSLEAAETDSEGSWMRLWCTYSPVSGEYLEDYSDIGLYFPQLEVLPDNAGQVNVDYRFEDGQVIREIWDAIVFDEGTMVYSANKNSFARRLSNAGNGALHFLVEDTYGTVSASFEIDGVASVLDSLRCHP